MAKLYALFKSEEDAQKAISKITEIDNKIKVFLFDGKGRSITDDILPSDTKIIGSPSSMISSAQRYVYFGRQLALSPFVFADFIITSKNSLASPFFDELPKEGFEAGLSITVPFYKKDALVKILKI